MNYVIIRRLVKRKTDKRNKVLCRVVDNPKAWKDWTVLGVTDDDIGDVGYLYEARDVPFTISIQHKMFREDKPYTIPSDVVPQMVILDEVSCLGVEMWKDVIKDIHREAMDEFFNVSLPNSWHKDWDKDWDKSRALRYANLKNQQLLKERSTKMGYIMVERAPVPEQKTLDDLQLNVSLDPNAVIDGENWKILGQTQIQPRYYGTFRLGRAENFTHNFYGVQLDETKEMKKYDLIGQWAPSSITKGVMCLIVRVCSNTAYRNKNEFTIKSEWFFPSEVPAFAGEKQTAPYEHGLIMVDPFKKGGLILHVEVPNHLRWMKESSVVEEGLMNCTAWLVSRFNKVTQEVEVMSLISAPHTDLRNAFETMNGNDWCWQVLRSVKVKPFTKPFLVNHSHNHKLKGVV